MYLNDNNVLYKGILERFIKNNKIESTNGITILSQNFNNNSERFKLFNNNEKINNNNKYSLKENNNNITTKKGGNETNNNIYSSNFINNNIDNNRFHSEYLKNLNLPLNKDYSNLKLNNNEQLLNNMKFDILKRKSNEKNLIEDLNNLNEIKKYEDKTNNHLISVDNNTKQILKENKKRIKKNRNLNLSNKKYSEKEWNKIYKKRFKTFEQNHKRKIEEQIKEKNKLLKMKEKEEENLCKKIPKKPMKYIKEVANRMYNESFKNKLKLEEKRIRQDNIELDASKYLIKDNNKDVYSFLSDETLNKMSLNNKLLNNNSGDNIIFNLNHNNYRNINFLKKPNNMYVTEYNNRRFDFCQNNYSPENKNLIEHQRNKSFNSIESNNNNKNNLNENINKFFINNDRIFKNKLHKSKDENIFEKSFVDLFLKYRNESKKLIEESNSGKNIFRKNVNKKDNNKIPYKKKEKKIINKNHNRSQSNEIKNNIKNKKKDNKNTYNKTIINNVNIHERIKSAFIPKY